jgi:DNA polymerase I
MILQQSLTISKVLVGFHENTPRDRGSSCGQESQNICGICQTSDNILPKIMSNDTPLILLVDGHSLAYRAFFAHARGSEGGLRTSTGIPTSVSYGFLKILLDVLQQQQPTYVAIAFDNRMPTFRHEVDDTYKAGRQETPQEFFEDLQTLRTVLEKLEIAQFEMAGFEADDLIGTLAIQGSRQGHRVKILSGDQDLFQLITDPDAPGPISVLHQNTRTGLEEFWPEQVIAKLGITPKQVIDYKALCGDSSDNIPGVKGIGAKGAVKLLTEYGSLDNLLASVDSVPGAIGKKLQEGVAAARHSYFMATIETNVPIVTDFEACRLRGIDEAAITPLFEQLEFKSFLRQLRRMQKLFGQQPARSEVVDLPEESFEVSIPTASDDDLWFDFAPTKAFDLTVHTVQTTAQWQLFLEELLAQVEPVAWDTETTSLDAVNSELVGLGCAWQGTIAYYLPVGHQTGENLDLNMVLAALKPYFEDPSYPKWFQNAKYDRLVLLGQGIYLDGVVFDTMLASYVLNPEGSHSLQSMAQKHLQFAMGTYEDLVPKGKTIAAVEIEAASRYCGEDVACTFQLTALLAKQLDILPGLKTIFENMELPLESVLAAMEARGIRIDKAYLQTLSAELEAELKSLEEQAHNQAGETFNLNSPKQLSDLLFQKLGLSAKKSRKTSLGFSTDAATLEKLRGDHPIVDIILRNRTLAKLKSTYVDALPLLVNPKTERIHTDFNQVVTATGRLSSSNPNLQNIPIRTSFSRRIRRAFVPEPGYVLMAADYSQIELRILAHLAEETVLIEAFQSGEDIHTLTAKLLLDKTEVTADERRLAKTINYGVVYGMGARRFARETGTSTAQAEAFITAFNRRYPGIFSYFERTRKMVLEEGYVETLLGRRRYFQGMSQLSQRDREAALRSAVNAPIQGTAADIVKLAMLRVEALLKGRRSQLLLQVHDELVLEIHPNELSELEPLIRESMENALLLSVPLRVEMNCGPNWMEAK